MNINIPTTCGDIKLKVLMPHLSWISDKLYFSKLTSLVNDFNKEFIDEYGEELLDFLKN